MHYILSLNVGNVYSHAYTINLWHAVRRRLESVPYRFICYTDSPVGLPNYIEARPVPNGYINGWWSKLMLFDDPEIEDGNTATFLDLDLILGPDFESLLSPGEHGFRILNDWARSEPYSFGSGVYSWKYGDLRFLANKFLAEEEIATQLPGDQNYLEKVFRGSNLSYAHFEKCYSWKWNVCNNNPLPLDWALIAFHGKPKPLDVLEQGSHPYAYFVKDHWAPSLTLETYRVAYAGRRAELLLTGPSLSDYRQDPSMISMGVNSIIFEPGWHLDHYLVQDRGNPKDPRSYEGGDGSHAGFRANVAKWYGAFGFSPDMAAIDVAGWVPTQSGPVAEKADGFRYEVNLLPMTDTPPFATANSVAFTAIQMLVYMGVREINVVGADMTGGRISQPETNGHLDGARQELLDAWDKAKAFCDARGVRLVMVNPVALKGRGFLEIETRNLTRVDLAGMIKPDASTQSIKGVELGVAAGEFSAQLLRAHPTLCLWGVDKWDDHHDDAERKHAHATLSEFGGRSQLIHGTFEAAAQDFPDEFFDFVYIDGYAHTGQDGGKTLNDWWPKLKPGGLFAGHDYDSESWPQTVQTVDAFAAKIGVDILTTQERGENQFASWYFFKPKKQAGIPGPRAATTPGKDMRFHLLGPPYTASSEKYLLCAYTQKVLKWARMMEPYGYEVHHYGHPDHELPDYVQHHDVVFDADWKKCFGDRDWEKLFFDAQNHEIQTIYNDRAQAILRQTVRPKDFILHFWAGNREAALGLKDTQIVEPGIGYASTFATFKVFESYAILNNCHGLREAEEKKDLDPWMMDTVIPNYFDPKDFDPSETHAGYYLYLGRIIYRKGLEIIVRLAQDNPDKQFLVAGQGELQHAISAGMRIPPNIDCVGYADQPTRKALMSNARAVIVPTLYNEPFGGVAVEAMLSGAPVITSDNGAFPETVNQGVSGIRCRNYAQYLKAMDDIDGLDRRAARTHAEKYLLHNIAPMYHSYFTWLHHLAHDEQRRWWTPKGAL